MKVLLILSVVLATSYALIQDRDWEEYKTQFNKVYKSEDEENKHYMTFSANKVEINEHNKQYIEGKVSFYKGINQFTDLTLEEAKKVSMGFAPGKKESLQSRQHVPDFSKPLPKQVDWRKKGVVTPVKNQESCGSCWAFSVVGAIEGQHAMATKKLVSLSEQNLVDCTKDIGNYGCGGGWPYIAYEYVIRVAMGIDTEDSYPYKAFDQNCQFSSGTIGAKSTAFAILTPGDETVLEEAVANVGPISVCIEASGDFMGYSGGILDDTTCTSNFDYINHCVLAVGYGTDDKTGKDYWLVKNSWGTSWGEEGYIRMSRNKANQCSVSTLASYPDVYPTL